MHQTADQTSSSKYFTVTIKGIDSPIRLSEAGGKALSQKLVTSESVGFVTLTDLYSRVERVVRIALIERIEPHSINKVNVNLIGKGKEELSRAELNKLEYGS